uniref:DUF5641 domain-containing protein n=1 Tax=Amphimedon queenslandica TaxID=400682 RepID=A0A1X7TF64_AMPQE
MWRMGLIDKVIRGRDKQIQGAVLQVKSGKVLYSLMKRLIQQLHPLEVHSHEDHSEAMDIPPDPDSQTDCINMEPSTDHCRNTRIPPYSKSTTLISSRMMHVLTKKPRLPSSSNLGRQGTR